MGDGQIAMQGSRRHLVLSTVHTNDCHRGGDDAPIDLGVESPSSHRDQKLVVAPPNGVRRSAGVHRAVRHRDDHDGRPHGTMGGGRGGTDPATAGLNDVPSDRGSRQRVCVYEVDTRLTPALTKLIESNAGGAPHSTAGAQGRAQCVIDDAREKLPRRCRDHTEEV